MLCKKGKPSLYYLCLFFGGSHPHPLSNVPSTSLRPSVSCLPLLSIIMLGLWGCRVVGLWGCRVALGITETPIPSLLPLPCPALPCPLPPCRMVYGTLADPQLEFFIQRCIPDGSSRGDSMAEAYPHSQSSASTLPPPPLGDSAASTSGRGSDDLVAYWEWHHGYTVGVHACLW